MSTPSTENASTSRLEQSARQKSFPFTVALIAAIHVVGLGGLLFLGCSPDQSTSNARPPATERTVPAAPTGPAATAATAESQPHIPPVDASPAGGSQPAIPPVQSTPVTATPATPAAVAPPAPSTTPSPVITGEAPAAPGGTSEYKIQKGDNAWKIAKARGVTADAVLKANPSVDWKKLREGQIIQVPGAAEPTQAADATGAGGGAPAAAPAAADGKTVHVVKAGENLGRIAKKYGVTIRELRAANKLGSDSIRVNQKLVIPAHKAQAAGGATGGGAYPGGSTSLPAGGTLAPAPEPRAVPATPGSPKP